MTLINQAECIGMMACLTIQTCFWKKLGMFPNTTWLVLKRKEYLLKWAKFVGQISLLLTYDPMFDGHWVVYWSQVLEKVRKVAGGPVDHRATIDGPALIVLTKRLLKSQREKSDRKLHELIWSLPLSQFIKCQQLGYADDAASWRHKTKLKAVITQFYLVEI